MSVFAFVHEYLRMRVDASPRICVHVNTPKRVNLSICHNVNMCERGNAYASLRVYSYMCSCVLAHVRRCANMNFCTCGYAFTRIRVYLHVHV